MRRCSSSPRLTALLWMALLATAAGNAAATRRPPSPAGKAKAPPPEAKGEPHGRPPPVGKARAPPPEMHARAPPATMHGKAPPPTVHAKAPPPKTHVRAPPPKVKGCVDSFPACPGWANSCSAPGVATYCPCMCGGGGGGGGGGSPNPAPSAPSASAPPPGGNNGGGGGSVSSIITKSIWDQMFGQSTGAATPGCKGEFYTYDAFIQAAAAFPGFGTTGDASTQTLELAAFLAQISHETTGATPGAYNRGLCFLCEANNCDSGPGVSYCDSSNTHYPCAPGQAYFGRGPIQISWNYNYGQCGDALGLPLLNNPGLVASDPVVAFKTAMWFWTTPQGSKPSCHDVMTTYSPSQNRFGTTTNIINGGIECGPNAQNTAGDGDRIGYLKSYLQILGAQPPDDGLLTCRNLTPF